MRVIVLTFDRLPARLLACYGNEWIETPGFDQLAARAAVFDRHHAEMPGPAGPAHPWWTGRLEFFEPELAGGPGTKSGERMDAAAILSLVDAGVNCRLVTERTEGLPLDAFSSWEQIEVEDGLDIDHSETPFARLVRRGLEIASARPADGQRELLWLHSRGVPSPWLPPRLFADLYLNELEEDDDEEAWDEHTGETIVPDTRLDDGGDEPDPRPDFDPTGILDELAGNPSLVEAILSDAASLDEPEAEPLYERTELEQRISRYIFAGYVSLLDHWLGRLAKGLEESAAGAANPGDSSSETILLVTAASGHVVGDRLSLIEQKNEATELCDELLQIPLLFHRLGETEFGTRCSQLTGPRDLAATIREFLGEAPSVSLQGKSFASLSSHPNGTTRCELLHLSPSGEVAIRDPEWLLVLPDVSLLESGSLHDHDELHRAARLFALPDDQWQVNDVSSRRPDVVDRLAEKLKAALETAGRLPQSVPRQPDEKKT